MNKKNIFIIGMNEFHTVKLERLPQAKECNFYAALELEDIRDVEEYNMHHLIEKSIQNIERSGKKVDAIANYYDFPCSVIVPIVADRFNVSSASLEAVLKCENKYWSRLEQQKVIPDNIPQFVAFDPLAPNAYETIGIQPPFWMKPIKSFSSFLAFRIKDKEDFDRATRRLCRDDVGFVQEPFFHLMQEYQIFPDFLNIEENFIAESEMSGWIYGLEGYVFNNEVFGYGIVDAVKDENNSSFFRYEYPSSYLSSEIQQRTLDIIRPALL